MEALTYNPTNENLFVEPLWKGPPFKRKSKGVYAVFDDFHVDDTNQNGEPTKPYFKAMCSKWMKESPEDLEEKWLFKICPPGKRTIVVAAKNSTRVHNKRGLGKQNFQSALPGGNSSYNGQRYTVLDCIHNIKNDIFYILDVIAWNNCAVTKCSTEVRFFFLNSRFEEVSADIDKISSKNMVIFKTLPFFTPKLTTIKEILSNPSYKLDNTEFAIDGLLFFNRLARYIRQETTMVLWLKPFMVPEILKVPIHDKFKKEIPCDYVNAVSYIEMDENKRKQKPSVKNVRNGKQDKSAKIHLKKGQQVAVDRNSRNPQWNNEVHSNEKPNFCNAISNNHNEQDGYFQQAVQQNGEFCEGFNPNYFYNASGFPHLRLWDNRQDAVPTSFGYTYNPGNMTPFQNQPIPSTSKDFNVFPSNCNITPSTTEDIEKVKQFLNIPHLHLGRHTPLVFDLDSTTNFMLESTKLSEESSENSLKEVEEEPNKQTNKNEISSQIGTDRINPQNGQIYDVRKKLTKHIANINNACQNELENQESMRAQSRIQDMNVQNGVENMLNNLNKNKANKGNKFDYKTDDSIYESNRNTELDTQVQYPDNVLSLAKSPMNFSQILSSNLQDLNARKAAMRKSGEQNLVITKHKPENAALQPQTVMDSKSTALHNFLWMKSEAAIGPLGQEAFDTNCVAPTLSENEEVNEAQINQPKVQFIFIPQSSDNSLQEQKLMPEELDSVKKLFESYDKKPNETSQNSDSESDDYLAYFRNPSKYKLTLQSNSKGKTVEEQSQTEMNYTNFALENDKGNESESLNLSRQYQKDENYDCKPNNFNAENYLYNTQNYCRNNYEQEKQPSQNEEIQNINTSKIFAKEIEICKNGQTYENEPQNYEQFRTYLENLAEIKRNCSEPSEKDYFQNIYSNYNQLSHFTKQNTGNCSTNAAHLGGNNSQASNSQLNRKMVTECMQTALLNQQWSQSIKRPLEVQMLEQRDYLEGRYNADSGCLSGRRSEADVAAGTGFRPRFLSLQNFSQSLHLHQFTEQSPPALLSVQSLQAHQFSYLEQNLSQDREVFLDNVQKKNPYQPYSRIKHFKSLSEEVNIAGQDVPVPSEVKKQRNNFEIGSTNENFNCSAKTSRYSLSESSISRQNSQFLKTKSLDKNSFQSYIDPQTALEHPRTPTPFQHDKDQRFFNDQYFEVFSKQQGTLDDYSLEYEDVDVTPTQTTTSNKYKKNYDENVLQFYIQDQTALEYPQTPSTLRKTEVEFFNDDLFVNLIKPVQYYKEGQNPDK